MWEPVQPASTGSEMAGAPAIWDGTIVVGSAHGTVIAFRLPD